ncbi:hypothetical protein [Algoriphagus sediminis]|uniref:Tetratricopeptide repeat protein n=1 Tax=Algoriphagus sediminis TaxID=3057113 RepID=A0ABT7YC06_9BACT|nr:hypothetical protein [Algoriphagus sediminis]MDN3204062.1 hypothetical protein [Algoriphagus sediminis]
MSQKNVDHKEFLDKDVVIHYQMGFDLKDFKSRIAYITAEIEKVRPDFDHEFVENRLAFYIAHSYLDADKFDLAIPYFAKEHALRKETDPFYLFPIQMLIRCYGEIGDFEKGLHWFKMAIIHFDQASGFDKLTTLKEYVHLITKTGHHFDEQYIYLIEEITEELGFHETTGNSIERILDLWKVNLKWNRRMCDIHLLKEKDIPIEIELWKNYIIECEVGWYRAYAKNYIADLKKKNADI